MEKSLTEIQEYYNEHAVHKLRDFVNGNYRVSRAWETVLAWNNRKPNRVLEVGCGIGGISWQMARRWPQAQVIGLDVSPQSIKIAEELFALPNLKFLCGLLQPSDFTEPFDLIVMMDVYEHISQHDRPIFHEALMQCLGPEGRIILSCPTVPKQNFLRHYFRDGLQPVDEDISCEVILSLAHDTQCEILKFEEMNIWEQGDYLHAVLARRSVLPDWSTQQSSPTSRGLKQALGNRLSPRTRERLKTLGQHYRLQLLKLAKRKDSLELSRAEKQRLVRDKLSIEL